MNLTFRLRMPQAVASSVVVLSSAFCIPAMYAQTSGGVEACDRPIGTLTIVEPDRDVYVALTRYRLGSPVAVIRLMVQQSKCFLIVDRGAAMRDMGVERNLARAGEMEGDANIGKGQLRAADFILTPAASFAESKSGGVGILGVRMKVSGDDIRFSEAHTSMMLTDTRTSIQIAAAEGKAENKPNGFRDLLLGNASSTSGMASYGAYGTTDEGKLVAASFLDNLNKILQAVKTDSNLMKRADKLQASLADNGDAKAGATFADGDVLAAKIDNVKVLAEPVDGAKTVTTVRKGEDLVYVGPEKDGYVKIQGSTAEGWVKKSLVGKKR